MVRMSDLVSWTYRHPIRSLSGVIVLFSGLVFGNISRWSIWFDEAFSAYIIRFDFGEITKYTAADVHPPLYYWTLKGWSGFFGDGELSLRLMSWLFAGIGIIGAYALVRQLVKNKPALALVAAIGLAVSPLIIRYAHEARMYTMVFAIVMLATNVLIIATRKGGVWWIAYGALLAVGMLTHYFAAFAWLSHWLWRYFEPGMRSMSRFFSREWLLAHVLGVGLFAWWIPNLISQFRAVTTGFWIPPVGTKTPVDYLSNVLIYQQYDKATGWWAVLFFIGVIVCGYILYRGVRLLSTSGEKSLVRLLTIMSLLPPVLLFVVSLPPQTSVFMDRYILYSVGSLAMLVAVCTATILQKSTRRKKLALMSIVTTVLIAFVGIYNVYHFGNYNKNTSISIRTRDVISKIANNSEAGQPIIADSTWMYYEAAAYDSQRHPIHYIAPDNYQFGSLAMLRDDDTGKITDISSFTNDNERVWYMSVVNKNDTNVSPPVKHWSPIKSVEVYDSIDDVIRYRATLYDTHPNEG